jgi:uncharacterized repeat protein (TIGR03806 family)
MGSRPPFRLHRPGRTLIRWVSCSLVGCLLLPLVGLGQESNSAPYGLDQRVLWTGSRVVGSPDPPLPYRAVKAFDQLKWERPLYVKRVPDGKHLVVVLQGGDANKPSKILRVEDRADIAEVEVVFELPGRLIYGLEFHPDFARNGWVYLFSNGPTGQTERQNRISRITVSPDATGLERWDANSELIVIEWRSMGHDGGDLVFGKDRMLYITSGDGTSDSDNWVSAQDVTNLLGGVLRIDVDHPTMDRPYSIPADNPFLDIPQARGELWAIGLRNPWRMSIDAVTGQIWVGNNGQDLWETAHLLGRGQNYGWSVYEGSHPFYAHRELGPGTLTLPTFEHHHGEARSLTGGVVYYGDRLPDLRGFYIYGDYATGKIWAGRHDGKEVISHREIADTSIQITGFSNTHRGELLIVDYAGALYRLEPNPDSKNPDRLPVFPRKLSETGLFTSTASHEVAPGVIPYSVIAPAWNDGAEAERFLALPGQAQIEYTGQRGWKFPDGSVIVQTLSVDRPQAGKATPQRVETRLLVRQQGEWAGYSYQWNESQDDAVLVERDGIDLALEIIQADGTVMKQPWRIPSRAECMACHSRAVNYVLGLTELQMNRHHRYGAIEDQQLRTLDHIGLFTRKLAKPPEQLSKLVDPHDASQPLENRVKAYLQTNCASCHVEAGGGNARMELEYTTALDKMQILSHYPQHETFGLSNPRIIAPGEPDQSVMLSRLSRRGRGQMPPLVSQRVDMRAVELFREWIASLPSERPFVRDWKLADLEPHLEPLQGPRSFEQGANVFRTAGCAQCHRLQNEFAGIGPNLNGLGQRVPAREMLQSILHPSEKIADQYAVTIVVTVDGEVIQGRIEKETEDDLIIRGKESFTTPRTILKRDIEQRERSSVSLMPEDTLNHLQQDQILDLLAYLLSDANPAHPIFQP